MSRKSHKVEFEKAILCFVVLFACAIAWALAANALNLVAPIRFIVGAALGSFVMAGCIMALAS